MIGAARLDPHVYEEVEGDRSATSQAMMVVVIAALAAGIGTLGAGGIAGLWQLAAMLIAVRQALDYQSSWRALGVLVTLIA